jgi:DNA-binding NtrC family response regulator
MASAPGREVEPDRLRRYRAPIETLKRVSGRLRHMLRGAEASAPSTERTPHLLVVDDEESICFSMKEYFSHNGFIVDVATEREEAERLFATCEYRVMIQDLRMGPGNRPEGLEMIRIAHERSPETRIVVLTAYGSTEMEAEAKRSGADAFLRKPQPLSQVAQVVRGLIESPRRLAAPRS